MADDVTTADRPRINVDDPRGLLKGPWRTATPEGGEYEVAWDREEAGGEWFASSGSQTMNDVTLERYFRPDRDQVIIDAIKAGETFDGSTITRIYLDINNNPIPGRRSTSGKLRLASWEGPESDAGSSEKAMLRITLKEAPRR